MWIVIATLIHILVCVKSIFLANDRIEGPGNAYRGAILKPQNFTKRCRFKKAAAFPGPSLMDCSLFLYVFTEIVKEANAPRMLSSTSFWGYKI